jgi:hypothetical protein
MSEAISDKSSRDFALKVLLLLQIVLMKVVQLAQITRISAHSPKFSKYDRADSIRSDGRNNALGGKKPTL